MPPLPTATAGARLAADAFVDENRFRFPCCAPKTHWSADGEVENSRGMHAGMQPDDPSLASDKDLLARMLKLVRAERGCTADVIEHLVEIDKRRLYLGAAYRHTAVFRAGPRRSARRP